MLLFDVRVQFGSDRAVGMTVALSVLVAVACDDSSGPEIDRSISSVELSQSAAGIVPEAELAFRAVVRDMSGREVERPVSWTNSDPVVAIVSDAGVVKGIAPGTAVITATAGGRGRVTDAARQRAAWPSRLRPTPTSMAVSRMSVAVRPHVPVSAGGEMATPIEGVHRKMDREAFRGAVFGTAPLLVQLTWVAGPSGDRRPQSEQQATAEHELLAAVQFDPELAERRQRAEIELRAAQQIEPYLGVGTLYGREVAGQIEAELREVGAHRDVREVEAAAGVGRDDR